MLTDDPSHPELTRGIDAAPVPQAPVYLVLSEEERAKGFVRPVRQSYRHVGCRPKYPLRDLTAEEVARYFQWRYVAFEAYPPSESPAIGRYWTEADLKSGCGTTTTMARPLAETYARDPKFYGSTYCCACRRHLAVGEFVWIRSDGSDGPVLGS